MKRLFVLPLMLFAVFSLATVAPAANQDQKDAAAAGAQDRTPAATPAQDQTPAAADNKDQTPAAADAQDQAAPAAQDQAADAKDKKTAAKDKKGQKDAKPKADAKKPAKNSKDDPEAIGARDVGNGVNFYSLEKEIALGKQLATEVERSAKVIDDPIIAEYVNRVGQNIVRNSDAKVPFTIKVLDSEEVNAFALPGGFFFVNSGLLLKADNEAELAGVMAHEIAHVAARHGTKQATRGEIAQIGMIVASIATGYGWTGYAIRQGAGLAIPIGFLQFSKTMEKEADYLGLQYLYKSGYDPTAFVDFFEKIQTLEKKKPGTMAKVFSSHPMTDDRIANSQREIQKILLAKPEYVLNTSEFNDVKGRLAMLHGRRKVETEDPNRPRLRRSPGSGNGPVDQNPDGTTPKTDEDERPTLKRRDS
jgi:Zn-dependent protease with chaperone function